MPRKIQNLSFLLFCFPLLQIQAQKTGQMLVKIVVADGKTHQILPYATVTIVELKKKIYTDTSASFSLNYSVSNHFTLHITHIDYNVLHAEFNQHFPDTLFLQPTETQLNEVVVTGVAGSAKIKKTAIALAVVSQKDLTRNAGANIIDAVLKSVPGVNAVTTGPNISKPFIRGLGYNRVLTLYDGVRQEGQQWGDEHGIEVDQYGIVRAEVIKGPASLTYGSDALAGVINLIPNYPNATNGNLHGEALIEHQTNNGLFGTSASLQQNKNGWLWGLRTSGKMAADYTNKIDGRVYNTGFREYIFSGMAGCEKPKAKHYLHFNSYQNLQEIPDGSRDSITRAFTFQNNEIAEDDIKNRPIVSQNDLNSYTIAPLHQRITHYRIYYKGNYSVGNSTLLLTVGWQQNNRQEYNHPTQPKQPGLDVQLNTYNYDGAYNFNIHKKTFFSMGVNGMYQKNQSKNATDFPIPNYQLFDIGQYLMVNREIGKWNISGGVRLDNRFINWDNMYTKTDILTHFEKQVSGNEAGAKQIFTAYRQHFSGVSASFGLVYNTGNWLTVKANLAKGYRSPNITEMGSNGLDPGAHIYYIGNKNFQPEYNWQTDLGIFANFPDAECSIELFNNNISNYIFLQKLFDPNGQPVQLSPNNFTYQYQQGSAQLYGIEATVSIHSTRFSWLHFQQTVSSITGINKHQASLNLLDEKAKYLPLIPPLKTVSRLKFLLPLFKKIAKETYFQTEVENIATQQQFYAVDNSETATLGYTLLHMQIGTNITNAKNKPICQLFISGNNLLDVAYQSHLNRLKYFEYYLNSTNNHTGVYNIGRNILLKAIFNW